MKIAGSFSAYTSQMPYMCSLRIESNKVLSLKCSKSFISSRFYLGGREEDKGLKSSKNLSTELINGA